MEDQLGRTCLHVTVEENNIRLTECLLVSGAEVNRPEGCGVTPLMIAIIKEQLEMTQLLLKYHAKAHGTFAGLIPSPLQLAESTNNDLIASLLKNHIGQDVQEEKAIFSAYLTREHKANPSQMILAVAMFKTLVPIKTIVKGKLLSPSVIKKHVVMSGL